jgi:hypothetical protein
MRELPSRHPDSLEGRGEVQGVAVLKRIGVCSRMTVPSRRNFLRSAVSPPLFGQGRPGDFRPC